MRYIGIDMSITSTGFAIFDSNGEYHDSGLVQSKTGEVDLVRFNKIISEFVIAIDPGPEDRIVFEQYAFSRGAKSQMTRTAELGGQLKRELVFSCDVEVNNLWVCASTTAKKFATGSGQGQKSNILKSVYKKWGFDTESDDEADAYVFGKLLFAARHYPIVDGLLKYEIEAVKSILKQNGISIPKVSRAKKNA